MTGFLLSDFTFAEIDMLYYLVITMHYKGPDTLYRYIVYLFNTNPVSDASHQKPSAWNTSRIVS